MLAEYEDSLRIQFNKGLAPNARAAVPIPTLDRKERRVSLVLVFFAMFYQPLYYL